MELGNEGTKFVRFPQRAGVVETGGILQNVAILELWTKAFGWKFTALPALTGQEGLCG